MKSDVTTATCAMVWTPISRRLYDRIFRSLRDHSRAVVTGRYSDTAGTNPLSGGIPTVLMEIGITVSPLEQSGGFLRRRDRLVEERWEAEYWIRVPHD
jgi:hypothetical protein